MFTAALLSTAIGLTQVQAVEGSTELCQTFFVQVQNLDQEVLFRAPGSFGVAPGSLKPRLLNVKEDPIPVDLPFGYQSSVPSVRLEDRYMRLDRSGALSLHSMFEALSLKALCGEESTIDVESLLTIVVRDEEIEEPVSHQASNRRLVDGVIHSVSIGA
jgi:hypothetical protein